MWIKEVEKEDSLVEIHQRSANSKAHALKDSYWRKDGVEQSIKMALTH